MEIKGICLLVATDDLTCQNIVDKMLQRCAYRVLHVGKAMDALKAIWEAKDDLNLVLTNIHRLQGKGPEILDDIQKMFDFHIIFMSPDNRSIQFKGKEIKVSAYALKLSSISDINELWESAMAAAEEAEKLEINQEGTSKTVSTAQDANNGGGGGGSSTMMAIKDDKQQTREKQKRKEPEDNKSEQEETSGDDSPVEKKPRMVWSKEMHQKFLEAIEMLGPDKAFPKKIVEVMNMPGLTRENVASHLQKYRICLRRAQEDSNYGMHLTNNVRGPCFLSNQSLLGFNTSERYSSVVNGMMPFQQNPHACLSVSPRLSTGLPSLTPAHLLASSNQETLKRPNDTISTNTDEQCHAASSSLQMEPNNITRNPLNSVFQIYGDQKENTLLTIEAEKLPTIPGTSIPDYSFIGLRLTDNGKSVQFGQSNISVNNNDIREETMFSSLETPQTETSSLDRLYHSSTSTSYIPEPLLQKGSFPFPFPSELPECPSSSFITYTSQQKPFTTFLGTSMLENSISCPSLLADSTPQQDHHLPHSCTLGYEQPFHNPSPAILGSISTTFASEGRFTLPPLGIPQPPISVQPSRDSMYGCTLHSSSILVPEEEMYIPIMETPGNKISFQDPTTTNRQVLQQDSPMPHDLNFIKLLNEAGISTHQLLWDEHFNDTIFHNTN